MPQQVKLFKSVEPDVTVLEREINEWLSERDVNVIQVFGNIAPQTVKPESLAASRGRAFMPSDLIVGLLYETKS